MNTKIMIALYIFEYLSHMSCLRSRCLAVAADKQRIGQHTFGGKKTHLGSRRNVYRVIVECNITDLSPIYGKILTSSHLIVPIFFGPPGPVIRSELG